MDWTRVKTAFIIMLVVCNAVLFYVYQESSAGTSKEKESELEEKITTMLQNKGLDIGKLKLEQSENNCILRISENEIDFEEEKIKFEKAGVSNIDDENSDGYLFTLKNDGKFDFKYFGDESLEDEMTLEDALEVAEKSIPNIDSKHGFKYANHYKRADGIYEIYYEQSYENIRILDGYIVMLIKGGKLLDLQEKLVKVDEDFEKNEKIIPYSLALYRLYSSVDDSDLPIKFKDVSLVKELKISDDNNKSMVKGDTYTYYRFIDESDNRYIIKASKD